MMNIEKLARRIEAWWQQVQALQQQTSTRLTSQTALQEAFDQLTEALEELQLSLEVLKQQHEDLITSQQRYQELFDFAPEGYLVTDSKGVIQEANAPALHLFNTSRETLVGMPLLAVVALADRQAFLHRLVAFRQGRSQQEWEVRVQRWGGGVLPVALTLAPRRDHQGRLVGLHWLLRDMTERKQVEEDLKAALLEKDLLLREVHHRVKNNLQVMSSLLLLQVDAVHDPQTVALFRDTDRRVRAMALIHDKLYSSTHRGQLDLAAYLGSLAEELIQVYQIDTHRPTLMLETEDVVLDIDKAVPCGLILNELLTNCLKHAFPGDQPGEIQVQLRGEGAQQVRLIVHDTGIGFPEAMDDQDTESFGLQLVQLLTTQLEGTLAVERQGGTVWTLTFPY